MDTLATRQGHVMSRGRVTRIGILVHHRLRWIGGWRVVPVESDESQRLRLPNHDPGQDRIATEIRQVETVTILRLKGCFTF